MSEATPIQPKKMHHQDEINELLTHLVNIGDLLMNVPLSGCCDDSASNAGWMVCSLARHIRELSDGGSS